MNLSYRADIQGLRAIAILAVVACHTRLPLFEGGFVGVDIFFVLSGYLITGLLLKEVEATGRIDFLAFYARRLKRLLPGLALMLLVSSLAAYVLLSPSEQVFQSQSSYYASFWASNFGYIFSNADYFNPNTTDLYLHTWSLGVEEQFYLVWPVLILFFHRRKFALLHWLVLVFLTCLALSIILTETVPKWGFYSMPSRGWQFALGGIVCLLVKTGLPDKYYSTAAHTFAGYAGLILILGSVLLIHEQMAYPGVAALVPSLGTALILFSQNSPVSKLLSFRPMQAIGYVSYSWYLWHWPVLILGTTLLHRTDAAYQIILVLLSFLLAVAVYVMLESPVGKARVNPKAVLASSFAIMLSGAWLTKDWGEEALNFALTDPQRSLNSTRLDLPNVNRIGCDGWYRTADLNACTFSDGEFTKTAVLIGDSIGVQWFSAFSTYATGEWRLIALTKSACPIADEPVYYAVVSGTYTVCEAWRNAAIAYIAALKPDAVFLGSSSAYVLRDWESATKRILSPLAMAAKKIYVIHGTPTLKVHAVDCLGREEWQPDFIASITECASVSNPNLSVIGAIDAAAAQFENVRTLDFNDLVCPDGMCKARNEDVVVFRDTVHVTDQFVKSIAPIVRSRIAEAD